MAHPGSLHLPGKAPAAASPSTAQLEPGAQPALRSGWAGRGQDVLGATGDGEAPGISVGPEVDRLHAVVETAAFVAVACSIRREAELAVVGGRR
jgi:hypothetical protein